MEEENKKKRRKKRGDTMVAAFLCLFVTMVTSIIFFPFNTFFRNWSIN